MARDGGAEKQGGDGCGCEKTGRDEAVCMNQGGRRLKRRGASVLAWRSEEQV